MKEEKQIEGHYNIFADKIIDCFRRGGKLLIFGCGGSASMSSHFAAEFICKFKKIRKPLPAIALTVDPAMLTAISNDFGFDYVFSRQVKALAKQGDIVIGISTSGNSQSVINGLMQAKILNIKTIDFPRKGKTTAEIQEYQLHLMHQIVEIVEDYYA